MKWEKVTINEVCEVVGGTTPSTTRADYWGKDLAWLSPIDLPEVGVISMVDKSQRMVTKLALKECGLKVLPPGSLVFSTRASIGKIGIVKTPLVTNQGFTNLIPSERVDVRYLAYTLKFFTPSIEKLGNTTTFKEVSRTAIRKFEIPLPPLHVQQQIADTLDKADALRRKDQELLQKYDEFAQSIFYEMFGDPVQNERGWEVFKLKSLGKVTTGNTPPRSNPEFYGNMVEWIKTDNISHNNPYPSFALEYLSKSGELVGRIIEHGSVLVTCIAGSSTSIGNCVLTNRRVAINQQINAFTPSVPFDKYFMLHLFRQMKKVVQNSTTKGMKRIITKSQFEELEFIYPPLQNQAGFGTTIRNLNRERELQCRSIDLSNSSFHALITKFFTS